MEELKKSLNKLVSNNKRLSRTYNNFLLKQEWPNIVGDYIAKKTTNIYIYDNKLFVKISDSVVKNVLLLDADNILEKVSKKFELQLKKLIL